ncbi:MAG: cellulase family glycosylhydrolase [Spirochaetales bacterium]|nr:cellulase family glycosylhydrolase [Spirochaetales bacterium]
MKEKLIVPLLLTVYIAFCFLFFSISCTMPDNDNPDDHHGDSEYDLTTEKGLLDALEDDEYMQSLEDSFAQAGNSAGLLYGDVNRDDTIDDIDVLLTARFYYNYNDAAFANPNAADVSDDGTINLADALTIARYDAGMIDNFPAEANCFIYGHFHSDSDYWAYFQNEDGAGSAEVTDGRLRVTIDNGGIHPWDIGIVQTEFAIEKGKSYTFTFRACTSSQEEKELTALFQFQQDPWTRYFDRTVVLSQDMQTFLLTFNTSVSDPQAGFNFHLGSPNENTVIYIDDVGLYEKKSQPVDGTLLNGDFSNGTANWFIYANDEGRAWMSVDGGELAVHIDEVTDPDQPYEMGFEQNNLIIENSGIYTFSFRARADAPKVIRVIVQYAEDPWTGYSDYETVNLTTDMQTFSYSFTMLDITDNAAQLVFHIGSDNTDLYIDDVTLTKTAAPAPEMPTPLFRGINLSNTFDAPAEGEWGEDGIMQEQYFQVIKGAGFDHIRIPISWSTHTETGAPYTIDPVFFERIDWVINNTINRGMIAVIDMHHYNELFENPAAHKDRFLAMWQQIGERYAAYPGTLYFELLNEPNTNLTIELWNQYLQEVYDIIRQTNPARKIVIDTASWGGVDSLESLVLPAGYSNIIVTFHVYVPWEFCFQSAPWMPDPPPPSEWSGSPGEKMEILEKLDNVLLWQSQHNNVPLWNGEFCVHNADMNSRVRWITFVARECEKRGIANTYWGFMNDEPGLYDAASGTWEKPDILDALLPE